MVCKFGLHRVQPACRRTTATRRSTLLLHFVVEILRQTGSVHGCEGLTIERGVKHGDVISPILFNAGLEHAMRKWKAKLFHHGVQLGHGNRLTNIRYADDLMLFAASSNDLIYLIKYVGNFGSGACSLRLATELGEDTNFDNVSVGHF